MPLQIKETASLHGTKGDAVIHSLAKLLEKVHRLEAKKRAAHSCPSSELGEHIALVEAQCALLEEQLRYARQVLVFSTKPRSPPDAFPECAFTKSSSYDNDDVFDEPEDARAPVSEQRPAAQKSAPEMNTDGRKRTSRKTTPKVPEAAVPEKHLSQTRRARSTSAVPHTVRFPDQVYQCRLNVADVPFILSKSTSASHSLPANLQNLVSLLKKAKPQSVGQDFADGTHRNVCVVGKTGLPRSNSEIDLRAASQPDAASRDLVQLMHQGEQLLKQLNQAQMPGTRHSLKCQCRRLISRIQARMADIGKPETGFSNSTGAKLTHKRKGTVKPRSASTSSHVGDTFNRVFMRELRRIQSHLEEQI
ncbi:uncharacterized protein [Dermacentor andersoni]|uniref:uncharacterized protein n=1 Tax=Dermacentor andersoni TaxID=34620 RepID=UPI002155A36F|nr:centrosomal protein cep57l1-like [Dermacentor andersoni]